MTEHKPFEYVQIDATLNEIFLVKQGWRKKRPWRVQVTDVHSGKRLGYFVRKRPSRLRSRP